MARDWLLTVQHEEDVLMSSRLMRRLAALVSGAIVATGLVVFTLASPAWAKCAQVYDPATQSWVVDYSNCIGNPDVPDDPDNPGPGPGDNAEPSCEFFDIWDEFCRGTAPCYSFDPSYMQDEDYARAHESPELPPKPSDDDHLIYVSCMPPGGERQNTYYWSSQFDEGISTRDRLLAAYGRLTIPHVTPVFNPPVRTLVNLDTWWWAEGGSTGPIVGTEALGLVAIAEPRSMVVSAAGQTVTCPIVTSKSDECRMVFRRSGDYTATMQIAYTIRFELGGQPFAVPGGNNDVLSMSSSDTVQVPVREVQSRVTKVD